MGFRLAWYATISTVAAGSVIISAFHQRSNFYSACVYLAQSNLCLMILTNLILLIYSTFVYSLQRICFGPLRPIEIEQLYEKGWFAVTETCLAMTIFREEVGAWFLLMFVALLTGKVWGWIGDGRVEILGQQPPANPRLFHIRLSTSLAMSVIYDLAMINYIINIVIQQARPNMMVMFLFEFAILTTSSLSTACRYGISIMEAKVVKNQTIERLIERRREVREERAQILRQRETAASTNSEGAASESNVPLPSEDDVDEMDIEVPGWETKGQWVLTLDLITDFIKFGIYTSFFVVLLMFYGIPIHIVRDLLLTARSCMKRLNAFLRYRRATYDMNERYQDATTEDIQREDTCIICRETMRPWVTTNPQPAAATNDNIPPRSASSVNERNRPKKLPCGHILHLGCLKSWLERQQVCPTCRRPVVDPQGHTTRTAANAGAGQGQPQPGQPDWAGAQQPPRGGMRMLNFGPLRVGFGQANLHELAGELGGPQVAQDNAPVGGPRVYGLELGFPRRAQTQQQRAGSSNSQPVLNLQEQLKSFEEQILSELTALQLTQQEWQIINLLRAELEKIREIRNGLAEPLAGNIQSPQVLQVDQTQSRAGTTFTPRVQTFQPSPTSIIPSGHADLPQGVTIPEGWSLLPLQSIDGTILTQSTRITPTTSNSSSLPVPNVNSDNNLNNASNYSELNSEMKKPANQNSSSGSAIKSLDIPESSSSKTLPSVIEEKETREARSDGTDIA
ncbi:ERAD-associated E3 ubiquitin-protein ligase HRD1 [Erysiphe neolycopersici]|uniref:RING-type E3 ubiquitin transferase n=1 Tax=Erysiphe neolycopersici TaxID=212602 RepID=A0A420HU36_9PEZI|nr:ERAD-associated E3 ubiquitin-protein ligase HRD1 [Erysiphe neolycopersici]